ncbi:Pycsar system effector family protein [Micromonospora echinospora]
MSTTPTSPIRDDILDVRAEINRADVKASILLPVALGALTLTGDAARPTGALPAVVLGYAGMGLLFASFTLAGLTILPRLSGGHGFMRYARRTADEVAADFTPEQAEARQALDRRALAWLSTAAEKKYRLVRWSLFTLIAGVAAVRIGGWL